MSQPHTALEQSLICREGWDVRVQLTFVPPMLERPTADISGGRKGNLNVERREVDVIDAHAQDPIPSLAAHGFEAVPFSASLPDGEIGREYREYFAKICAAAVKRETGAAVAVGLSATVQVRRSDGVGESAPIIVSHCDYTPASAARRAAELIAKQAPNRVPSRFAEFNAWWLARSGPQDRPLALCDATSIAPADLQFGQVETNLGGQRARGASDSREVAFQRFSPRQRWFWYPRLGPDRLLLFCGFDSDSSRPSMVTHCSFINPDCPADAPPRVSVECRCFAFW